MSADSPTAGDVVRYEPDGGNRWCREGMAVAQLRGDGEGRIVYIDTYWAGMSGSHILTAAEATTVERLFNVGDYDELPRGCRLGSADKWAKYAPADRQVVTSQHGLQRRWFVRKGASEDHATQVENARVRLAEAESKLRSAQWSVESAQRDLANIEAQAVSS